MIIEFFRMEECNYAYQKYLSTEASHWSHWGVIQHVSPDETLTNVSTKCISHQTTWLHSYSFQKIPTSE